jgi:hypothetical protein
MSKDTILSDHVTKFPYKQLQILFLVFMFSCFNYRSVGLGSIRLIMNTSIDDFLENLPPIEEIHERVAKSYDRLTVQQEDGSYRPLVCIICDEFITSRHQYVGLNPQYLLEKGVRELFEWSNMDEPVRLVDIEAEFKFEKPPELEALPFDFTGMALSPRAVLRCKNTKKSGVKHHLSNYLLSCCKRCQRTVHRDKKLPLYAIANKNFVGCPPACLATLTEIEISMLTMVKCHGICITYTGGTQQNLRGTLTFMRTKERSTVRAAAQLEGLGLRRLGLDNQVLVLAGGNMTPYQHETCKQKATINLDKIMLAIEWLVKNHETWKEVNLAQIRSEFECRQPVFVDVSSPCPSVNANVEETELFQAYYPDGATTETEGGFETAEEFRNCVIELKQRGFDVEFTCNLEKKFLLRGDDGLLDSLLLQFPRRRGGTEESRIMTNGQRKAIHDLPEFLQHLSRLSQPVFQKPLFQLIAYNYISKQSIMRTARFFVRGEMTASAIAAEWPIDDLQRAIEGRRTGRRNLGTEVAKKILNGCEASGRALGHTNEAAGTAKTTGNSMQHHFGTGSIWLTVNFDDTNGHTMDVFSGVNIDDERDIEDLTDKECRERFQRRNQIRLDYPGISALNFEALLEIVLEDVVRWDTDNDEPNVTMKGYFGTPMALIYGVEEQGKKTLHSHIQIWIKGYAELQRLLLWGSLEEKEIASKTISRYHEHVASNALMPIQRDRLLKVFEHDCTAPLQERVLPIGFGNQHLRDLRHRKGFKHHEGALVRCIHCGVQWTNEEMIRRYLVTEKIVYGADPEATEPLVNRNQATTQSRLLAYVVKYQRGSPEQSTALPDERTNLVISAAYNSHKSCHVPGCFKCQGAGKKKNHKCGPTCECRMRLPDLPRKHSIIREIQEGGIKWFEWTGTGYNVYQNSYCPAISQSKLACNTNAQLIIPGPISYYQFKYMLKKVQHSDAAEFQGVLESMKSMAGRVHDDDNKEALRRMLRALFAHHQANIVSATMSSHLIRNKSRFHFSHEFQYCPIEDLISLLEGYPVRAQVAFSTKGNCWENSALHYLCRPIQLEQCSVKEFYEQYNVVRKVNAERTQLDVEGMDFIYDTGHFKHPSFNNRTKKFMQWVVPREQPSRVKVLNKWFQDTASFKADIMYCGPEYFNTNMERYARAVLTLLKPFRHRGHLLSDDRCYPYTVKLREIYREDMNRRYRRQQPVTFTPNNATFLQNIQDSAYNCSRNRYGEDILQSCTQPFNGPVDDDDQWDNNDDESENNEAVQLTNYDKFVHLMAITEETPDVDDEHEDAFRQQLGRRSFRRQRDKGHKEIGYKCGKQGLAVAVCDETYKSAFMDPGQESSTGAASRYDAFPRKKRTHHYSEIVRMLFTRKTLRKRTGVFKNNPDAKVPRATGSAASISAWAVAGRLDTQQKRAFESILASFVLTYYNPIDEQENSDDRDIANYKIARQHLLDLRGLKPDTDGKQPANLIMLLHGPGGSGKSTVIEIAVEYAREFCTLLHHPFTPRTIIVTAMSGVAATILLGETTHSVLGLNRKIIKREEIEEFADTRLVVIDEISFASQVDYETIEYKMRKLMENNYENYGGCNIVFSGDFSQMEPVRRQPIYKTGDVPQFNGFVNGFVELNGVHRYTDKDGNVDEEWARINTNHRNGKVLIEDIEMINKECLISPSHMPPPNVQVATYTNRDRDAINCGMFEEFCRVNKPADGKKLDCACIVYMDDLQMKDSMNTWVDITSNRERIAFYDRCGEDDCRIGNMKEEKQLDMMGRADPILKLYHNCPLMYTINSNVRRGQANGSRVRFEGIRLKPLEEPFEVSLDSGTVINAVFARQIQSILV